MAAFASLSAETYGEDLAYVHHAGFGSFARDASGWLLADLRDAGLTDGLVVDLACGSGIWASALVQAGYGVFGIDASAAMIAIARRQCPPGHFVTGSVHDVSLPPCIAATAIGEGVSYLDHDQSSVDLPALLARVFEALIPGGLFIFDVVERSTATPMAYDTIREGDGWSVTASVIEDPAASVLTRTITTTRTIEGAVRRTTEVHRLQTFTCDGLHTMLAAAGFRAWFGTAYGDVKLPPQRVAVRAQKPHR